jgi:hypothetical protein
MASRTLIYSSLNSSYEAARESIRLKCGEKVINEASERGNRGHCTRSDELCPGRISATCGRTDALARPPEESRKRYEGEAPSNLDPQGVEAPRDCCALSRSAGRPVGNATDAIRSLSAGCRA